MTPTLVLNVVGLTQELLGPHTPHLSALAKEGAVKPIAAVTPAVTCTAQATYLTGKLPREHGIVANGWYFRDLAEVWLWRQSNKLVQGPKIWDVARERNADFTVANLFWWYNMYSSVDWAVTPRPMYPADGRKLPDVHTKPASLRDELNGALGNFPLFKFWGPVADITSSRWITDASLHVMRRENPTLALVYLPHLDYNLQRLGPNPENPLLQADLQAVDALCGELIALSREQGRRVVVLSEYGITPASGAIHINRALRQHGYITVREEQGRELLDAGACQAFAVVDHQVAHVYVPEPALVEEVRQVLQALPGVSEVLDEAGKKRYGLDHPRSGELVVLSEPDRWFSYYYWLEDARAPDFATTVDIHRKPGYDPVELFFDPELLSPKLSAGVRLAKRKLGFRALMDVISANATDLVKGTHGVVTADPRQGPLLIAPRDCLEPWAEGGLAATDVFDVMLRSIFGA